MVAGRVRFWTDLTLFQKWFMIIFALGSLFSFFSPLFIGGTVKELFSFTAIIGLVCALSGVLTSIYQARGEVIVYTFILINTITYAWIAYTSDLYGQVIQNLFLLLPIQIYGLFAWKKSMAKSKNNQIEIKVFSAKDWLFTLISILVFWGGYYVFLNYLPQIIQAIFGGKLIAPDPSVGMDSLTTVLTVTAMFLTSKRYVEQWWFWILCNIGVVLFIEELFNSDLTPASLVGDLSGAINWLQYGIGAVYGFYLWKKMYRERNNTPTEVKSIQG
ncbi:nicotinamide riboside transporter PnuC [Vibrio alfacsensis]|uniref:nicotinamide riboside transporter PnuC n=1 Tax=Vibrio alfacsensis TaxID=1074311 RepID=UPI004067AAE1